MAAPLNSDDLVDTGEKLHQAGQLQEAESYYRKALEVDPGHPGALFFLAGIAYEDDRLSFAIELVDELLRGEPDDSEAWHLLGMIALKQEQFSQAGEYFKKALIFQPAYALAHYSLGHALSKQREDDQASACFQRAITLKPDFTEAHLAIGNIYKALKKPDEAIASFKNTIALDPTSVMAYSNLADLLMEQGRTSEVLTTLQQAVALDANDSRLWVNLCRAYRDAGNLMDAIECARQAVEVNPDFAAAHNSFLSLSQYLPNYPREKSYADHIAFGQRFGIDAEEIRFQSLDHIDSRKRLRIGFVSGDLRRHPVGYFLEGVLRELYSRNTVDIVVYSNNAAEDDVTERLRASAHAWTPVSGISDDDLYRQIRSDSINILIDLAGHTAFNRLSVFARKPAPVQVTWLGYWETTGLGAIDYIFCDSHGVHDDEIRFFIEKPWFLPYTRLCFTPPNVEIDTVSLPALSTGHVTFGSFNDIVKMTDRVVTIWSQILNRVPNSRLMLKSKSLAQSTARENVTARFAAHGVDADRLLLKPASPYLEYLAAYNHIDIALDTFPFPGGTISVQGIWMGVPMISMRGDRIISRQGEAILHNLDLQDWIADDEEQYIDLAVRKAQDLASLASLRKELRSRLVASPLCDSKLFAENLEAAFKGMWAKYCESTSVAIKNS